MVAWTLRIFGTGIHIHVPQKTRLIGQLPSPSYMLERATENLLSLDALTTEGECHFFLLNHRVLAVKDTGQNWEVFRAGILTSSVDTLPQTAEDRSPASGTHTPPFRVSVTPWLLALNTDFVISLPVRLATGETAIPDTLLGAKHWGRVSEEQKRSVWIDVKLVKGRMRQVRSQKMQNTMKAKGWGGPSTTCWQIPLSAFPWASRSSRSYGKSPKTWPPKELLWHLLV